ncbi:hypothetical protein ABZP36_000976 [Zizania latifolia]
MLRVKNNGMVFISDQFSLLLLGAYHPFPFMLPLMNMRWFSVANSIQNFRLLPHGSLRSPSHKIVFLFCRYCLCGYGNIHHIASLSLASSCARGYDLDSNSYRQHQFFTRGSNKVILENSFILCTKILFGQQR